MGVLVTEIVRRPSFKAQKVDPKRQEEEVCDYNRFQRVSTGTARDGSPGVGLGCSGRDGTLIDMPGQLTGRSN